MFKIALIATALIVPTAALGQSQTPAAAPVTNPKANTDLDKVVCRSEEEIGSRLRAHKVCMTVQQWKQYQEDYKEQVQEIQSLASVRRSG